MPENVLLLSDLFDDRELRLRVADGLVTDRTHPVWPSLHILNYTERAQYADEWDDVVRRCRGLVYDAADGRVIARPLDKFFNYGDHNSPHIDVRETVSATDKRDGSLGIVVPLPDGTLWVASRGGFDTAQAKHATDLLHSKHARFVDWAIATNWCQRWTLLVEIVYPENRIVLDYGELDDLVLIGSRSIVSGDYEPARGTSSLGEAWRRDGEAALIVDTLFDNTAFSLVLSAPPRPNAEGMVVAASAGRLVKLKQDDYVNLHHILYALSAVSVWEKASSPDDTWLHSLPDSVRPAVEDYVWKLRFAVARLEEQARSLATQANGAIWLEYPLSPDQRVAVVRHFEALAQQGAAGPEVLSAARELAFRGDDQLGDRQRQRLWRSIRPFGQQRIPGLDFATPTAESAPPSPFEPDDEELNAHVTELVEKLSPVIEKIQQLNSVQLKLLEPLVDEVLADRLTDSGEIGHLLDGLLDLSDTDEGFRQFEAVCRHLYFREPALVAFYWSACADYRGDIPA